METDGRCMSELLVGLGEVDLVGVEELAGDRLEGGDQVPWSSPGV